MEDTKPIRRLMLVSFLVYAAYLLFYLVIVFGRLNRAHLMASGWLDLLLHLVSGLARVLLCYLVLHSARTGTQRSFVVTGV